MIEPRPIPAAFEDLVHREFAPVFAELGLVLAPLESGEGGFVARFRSQHHELTVRDLGSAEPSLDVLLDGEPLRAANTPSPEAPRSVGGIAWLSELLPSRLHVECARRHAPPPGGVAVVDSQPFWPRASQVEAARLASLFDSEEIRVHPIGSTSVPALPAKPIIDLLIEAPRLEAIDAKSADITALGYEVMGEFGIPGRRYFRRDLEPGVRLFHVHAFVEGSEGAVRHLAFRDYLRAHPTVAREYGALKAKLAAQHRDDVQAYMDGKHDFIQRVEQEAVRWRA